jgi:hypothetical protein
LLLLLPRALAAQESANAFTTDGWSIVSGAESSVRSRCQPLRLLSEDAPATCSEYRLDGADGSEPIPDDESSTGTTWAGYEKKQWLWASLVAAGVIAGGSMSTFLETPQVSYHWTNEGFFGRDTYVGGADKASHFVDYAIITKELANLYGVMGFSRRDSILMGAGLATLTGLVFEIGDGQNVYGFSWEDLVMDVLGVGAAALISALELDDLVGFRHGLVLPPPKHDVCCAVEAPGRDYSTEIYTADLHVAGVGRRLGINLGPLRYLLVSLTYGTKGYPHGLPGLQERQVGIEIGLNLKVILDDLGVGRNTWWGYTLHAVFDNLRLPFTAVGFRYDLNHRKWIGPDAGNGYAAR